MLKIKAKAGAITNLTDARYFAAREVEWVGFPIGEGEGLIEAVKVKAIVEWLDGVKFVGEFSFASPDEIISLSQQIGLNAVQVGMFTSLEDIAALKELTVIKEVVVNTDSSANALDSHLNDFSPYCDSFLLNFSAANLSWQQIKDGQPYPIDFLKKLCNDHRIILQIDCKGEEVNEIIETLQPHAIAFSGGEEEKVGFKSFDELDEILDELEIE